MCSTAITRLTDFLVQNNIIQENNRDIYEYGLYEGAFMLLNFLTSLVIALTVGKVLECILFLVSYIPLRSNGGGYHAKTHLRCYFLSTLVLIAALFVIQEVEGQFIIFTTLAALSVLIIFALAPIEDKNKPLDKIEITVYRKRARLILFAEVVVAAFMIFAKFYIGFASIAVAQIILAVMLIMGYIKNKLLSV